LEHVSGFDFQVRLSQPLIRARITDQAGAHLLSTPIAVRIILEPAGVVLAALAAARIASTLARARTSRTTVAALDHPTACAV
jgi:hypothetical protein